jgi:hypothetical protein
MFRLSAQASLEGTLRLPPSLHNLGPRPYMTAPNVVSGKILEAEVKVSVDPAQPLPLACGLYAVEAPEGVWLCAYYGSNRSVFDYLPQKGGDLNEATAGISFHKKEFVPKEEFQASRWELFKHANLMTYGAHGG